MRKLEFLNILSIASIAIHNLLSSSSSLDSSIWILLFITFALHIAVEGYRWQLAPVYIALFLEIFFFSSSNAFWRIVQLSVCLISAVLAILLPVFRTDMPAGPFKVSTTTIEISDHSRPAWDLYGEDETIGGPRRLPVRIWYPIDHQGAAAKKADYLPHIRERAAFFTRSIGLPSFLAHHLHLVKSNSYTSSSSKRKQSLIPISQRHEKFPVMFFSHGYCSSADFNTALIEHVCSYGVIVVAVEHSYDAAVTYFPSDKQIVKFHADAPDHMVYTDDHDQLWKFRGHHLNIRVKDLQFACDTILALGSNGSSEQAKYNRLKTIITHGNIAQLSELFCNRIDNDNIMAMGHSFGGGTAVKTCIEDERFRAAIGLDAWLTPLGPRLLQQSGILDNNKNILLIQAREFVASKYFWGVENDKYCQKLEENSNGHCELHVYDNAGHQDFLDLPMYAPLVSQWLGITGPHGIQMQRIIRNLVDKFLLDIRFTQC